MSDVNGCTKLQALVYDFLSPTAVTADYAIGLGKLSANEQPFVGSKSVTDNPIYIRFLFYDLSRCVSQHKQSQYRLNRDRALFPYLSLLVADAPQVYVHSWTLCCFHSLIGTHTFQGALRQCRCK